MNGQPPNVRTHDYWDCYEKLPARIQQLAQEAFKLFVANPSHPSLRHHALDDNKKGQHRAGSFEVSITMKYRAIYVVDGETNVWYWIGTHNDFNNFTGKK